MNTFTIREKLHRYIDFAEDKKIEALFTMLETDMGEEFHWWEDADFLDKLERISRDLKNGTDKGVIWESLKDELLSLKND